MLVVLFVNEGQVFKVGQRPSFMFPFVSSPVSSPDPIGPLSRESSNYASLSCAFRALILVDLSVLRALCPFCPSSTRDVGRALSG